MKRRILLLLTTVAFLAGISGTAILSSQAEDKEVDNRTDAIRDRDDTRAFMRVKLASSQKVMEGLVTKDFTLIKKGADEWVKMSDAAAWQKIKDPVYKHYHADFRRLAAKLGRLAEKGNLEGASFIYMQSVAGCISCHEHVRDVQKLADEKNGADGPIRLLADEQ